jgi:hypothetical protein
MRIIKNELYIYINNGAVSHGSVYQFKKDQERYAL